MPEPKSLALFALKFTLCFGLLVAPWKGFREGTARATQGELRWVLNRVLSAHSFQTGPAQDAGAAGDSEVVLADPTNLGPDGRARDRVMVFDSRSLFWMPHAMFLALWGATPVRWSERWRLLLRGMLGTHLVVLLTLVVAVFAAKTGPSSPALQKAILGAAHAVLVQNLWSSFVAPFLIWLALVNWKASQPPPVTSGN